MLKRCQGNSSGKEGNGVDEGVRTLDRGSPNPELYQLSYVHRIISFCVGPLINDRSYCSSSLPERLMARPAGLEPATIRLEADALSTELRAHDRSLT